MLEQQIPQGTESVRARGEEQGEGWGLVCRGTFEGASRVPIPFRTSRRNVVLEKTLESPLDLDCKKIQPVHPKENQS